MPDHVKDRIAIEETKARYCRFLDTKDWEGFGSVYTEDVYQDTTESGGSELRGRAALVEMVSSSLKDAKTVHHIHAPEIVFIDDDTADAIFAMKDRIVWSEQKSREIGLRSLTGWGHYHERYVREADGNWRIATQRLTRLDLALEPLGGEAG